MTEYTGRLTIKERQTIDALLLQGKSIRQVAKDADHIHGDITYGQVRYYVEHNRTTDGTVSSQEPVKPPATGPRILVFDIETAPYVAYVWSLWKTNAIDVAREWFMLSFAYGWYDIDNQEIGPIDFVSCGQDPTFKAGSDDDSYVASKLWRLFDQADVIIGQNHERFDIKKANERFFVHNMMPPSPYSTIDTKRVWNKSFAGSAALKYMARKADVALKQSNRGFSLWLDCMNNDPQGWAEMEEYNRADVVATAEVYTRLIPWVDSPTSNVVNFGHWHQGEVTCKKCGNTEDQAGFVKRGKHRTAASVFQTLECKKCGGYSREYQRIPQRHDDDKTFLR